MNIGGSVSVWDHFLNIYEGKQGWLAGFQPLYLLLSDDVGLLSKYF